MSHWPLASALIGYLGVTLWEPSATAVALGQKVYCERILRGTQSQAAEAEGELQVLLGAPSLSKGEEEEEKAYWWCTG